MLLKLRIQWYIWTSIISFADKRNYNDKYRMTGDRVLSGQGQGRDCLLTYVPEGKIEVTGRRGRRHKEPLDDLK
jgi:hypothetical protein